jgi:amino acid permease
LLCFRLVSRVSYGYRELTFIWMLAYLVVVVIRGYIWPFKNMPVPGEIWLIHFTPDFVSTFPIQVFAFTCAQNVRFPFLALVDFFVYDI